MKPFPEWFRIGPLGVGRTTALAKAAKEIGATFVCQSEGEARRIGMEHGIRAVGIQSDPIGLRGPFIFDHEAVQWVVDGYEAELQRLQRRERNLTRALEDVLYAQLGDHIKAVTPDGGETLSRARKLVHERGGERWTG